MKRKNVNDILDKDQSVYTDAEILEKLAKMRVIMTKAAIKSIAYTIEPNTCEKGFIRITSDNKIICRQPDCTYHKIEDKCSKQRHILKHRKIYLDISYGDDKKIFNHCNLKEEVKTKW